MVKYTTTTNRDGVARFSTKYGNYNATIVKDGFKTTTVAIPFSENSKDFRVTFEHDIKHQLTFFVTDENSASIPGALVRLVGNVTVESVTDNEGKAIFEVGYGNYTATISKNSYYTSTMDITFSEDHDTFTATLESIPQTDTLRITVSDNDGTVEGARVRIVKDTDEYTATTGQDGTVEFQVEYGDYDATITKDGYLTATEEIAFRSNHKNFNVTIEKEPTPTPQLTFTVVDDLDTAIENVLVEVGHNDEDMHSGRTDSEGKVSFTLEYDTYTYVMSHDGYKTVRGSVTFDSEHINFNVTLEPVLAGNVMQLVWDSSESAEISTRTDLGDGIILSDDATAVIEWGDGTTTDFEHPTDFEHTYEQEGEYTVTVTILDGTVEHLGVYCFGETSALKSISFPDGLEYLADSAFRECTNLESVTFHPYENTLSYFEGHVFYGCEKLNSISIPDSLTELGDACFQYCASLNNIKLSNQLSNLPQYCFANCTSITSFTSPQNIRIIDTFCFEGCTGLEEFTGSFNLLSIEGFCFEGCTSLENVVLYTTEESIPYVGSYCFAQCTNLQNIVLPGNLEYISDSCFENSGLTHIIIPDTVTGIGEYAFTDCTDLVSVLISNNSNLMDLATACFQNCTSLSGINLPDGLVNIGKSAFSSCSGLEAIEIPDTVTNIGNACFMGCFGLQRVHIPTGLTTLEESTFNNCRGLISVTIPMNVTSLGTRCFQNCKQLTSITIPNNVTSIGDYCFAYCARLADIYMSENVTRLGNYCFSECPITSIIIPNTVTSMSNIVYNCMGLNTLDLYWEENVIGFSGSYDDNLNWASITINIPADTRMDYASKGYPEGSLHERT